jgi:hypothetical protein
VLRRTSVGTASDHRPAGEEARVRARRGAAWSAPTGRALAWCALVCWSFACGGASSAGPAGRGPSTTDHAPAAEARAADGRAAEDAARRSEVDTSADPPPWSPPPGETAAAGRPAGLVVRGREDQARRVVVRMLEALRDRDLGALEQLLADPLVRRGADRPRADVIAELVRGAEANLVGPGVEVSAFFAVAAAEVQPVGAARRQRPSSRLRDDDLIVRFAVTSTAGRRFVELPFVQGGAVAEIVVRTGSEPRVVGF